MRHAKSSWKHSALADWERPLNGRGSRDAPRMGCLLWDEDLVPELILSSTAVRARQTAEAVAERAGYEGDVVYLDDLYGGTSVDYMRVLRSLPGQEHVVLVVGHNPELQDVLGLLTDQAEHLPTAAIVHLRLPIESWADLRSDTIAELVQMWRPRELQ